MSVDTDAPADAADGETDVSEVTESPVQESATPAHRILGGVDVGVGVLLLGAIWFALPARWAPVDVGGSVLALGFVVSGAALLARTSWAVRVGRLIAVALLLPGAGLVTAIALAGADLFGRYGPVGMGGGLILFVVFLLLVPYLVLLPAAQIWLLGEAQVVAAPEASAS